MKYILITILAVSGTIQAKSFSLSDYASQTGKIPAKKVVKNTISFSEKVENTSRSLDKVRAKIDSLTARKSEVYKQYSEALTRISQSDGDSTLARRMAEKDRKSRLFTIDAEIKKAKLKIANLSKVLAYYEHMVKGAEMAKKLKVEKLITSSC